MFDGKTLTIVAAMDKGRVIGNKGQIPWKIPDDIRSFQFETAGKSVIMGRSTFESIGHALPDRDNIVLTTREGFVAEDVKVAHTCEEALHLTTTSDVSVIGGAEIYREFLPCADWLILSVVEGSHEGDTFFPHIPDSFVLRSVNPFREFTLQTFENVSPQSVETLSKIP